MRESSNLNLDLHHQHEDFHGPSSSSSLAAPPPFHFVATSNRIHDWNQHLLLNNGDDQFNMAPRELMPMVQDLGNMFQWPTAADQQGYMSMNQEQLVSAKGVKEEELAGVGLQQNYHGGVGFDHDNPMGNLGGGFGGRSGMSFGTVLPTAGGTICAAGGPNQLAALPYSSSPGVDHVRALDLFSSSGRFGRSTLCTQAAAVAVDHHSMALLRREDWAYGLASQLQELPAAQLQQASSLSQKQVSPSSFSGDHSNGNLEYKATQTVAKKPRLESRASFSTPFKVRKEKLGDRIAALQQLVAPFGKTDTASVLMEAIGYIKFLQDQVETLSVPYMRCSNNKKMRTSVETSNEGREEPKLDLRSRGLCLVPLSCTSYVTEENGGVWSPPNYRGAT